MFSAASCAGAARRGLGRHLVNTATQCSLAAVSLSSTPAEPPLAASALATNSPVVPPAGLPSTAQRLAAPSAKPAEGVATSPSARCAAFSGPASLAPGKYKGIERKDTGGPATTPSFAAPWAPAVKLATTSGTNPRGGGRKDSTSLTPEVSEDEMDTSGSQDSRPTQQAPNERPSSLGLVKKTAYT